MFRRGLGFARTLTIRTHLHSKSMPVESADAVVIGAGVVGLAVARELAINGREVLVLESASTFGTGISSRNSEVVHAGIYYPTNSPKASLCVKGRKLLYEYCEERGIPYKQLGKLIVAVEPAEIPKLHNLMKRGIDNGVEGLKMMEGSEAMQMEPELYCSKALLSPSSGIIDSHSLMLHLGEAEAQRAVISYNTTVIGTNVEDNEVRLHVCESEDVERCVSMCSLEPQLTVVPKLVINCAGLNAVPLAETFHPFKHEVVPRSYYARGCYFTLLESKSPFSRLIYPIPEDGGLGVHVTLDLDGRTRFGPDVEWIPALDAKSALLNRFDYSVDPNRAQNLYPEIRKYYPNLKDDSLEPGYSGIRPKLSGPKQPPMDFFIQGEEIHGVPGLVNLFGIESPGLTSCLAIAEYVASRFSR